MRITPSGLGLSAFLAFIFCQQPVCALGPESLDFSEVWAYHLDGQETHYRPGLPITDLAVFGAGVGSAGELVGVPKNPRPQGFKGRIHLVIAEVTSALATHVTVNPKLPLRKAFIDAVVKASETYDGVQIDYEKVLQKEKDDFYSFLEELKSRIGGKIFSVAVPALTADTSRIWDYRRLDRLADKIFIMAYDEHWSGSRPGSVASLAWCSKVAWYAKSQISPGKLILGLPFYGRAWTDKNHARALGHSRVLSLMEEMKKSEPWRVQDMPFFEYTAAVTVTVHFEDALSLRRRLELYHGMGIQKVGFWRLGLEDPGVWKHITHWPEGSLVQNSVP